MHQPAKAQYSTGLEFLRNNRGAEGASIELRTIEGQTCRYKEGDRPEVLVGAGMARSYVIPGVYGNETAYPAKQGSSEPVGGVIVRLPFGGPKSDDCNALMKLEEAKLRLSQAQLMFEDGLIDEDQLKKVADATYAALN
jgi:hypothetical protein